MDMWDALEHRDTQQAIQLAESAYASYPGAGEAISLGACYLWARQWDSAYLHFRTYIESARWSADFAFQFAGTAKWCAGERQAAVAEWTQGIDVDYADMGGGITIPLHLFFVAASDHGLLPMDEAVGLLQARLQAKSRDGWPNYLAKLLLGEMSCEDAVTQSKEDVNHLWGDDRSQAEQAAKRGIDFWQGVRLLSMGDTAGFLEVMKQCSQLSWEDFDTDRDLMIDLLRSSELYLARSEIDML